MPFIPPALDDRSFDDLVEEVLARIPGHTSEWTHPRLGDPGRTLIELFAWMFDTLLYRANLIPERQRLVFLKLLGVQMRPARPASGLISVSFKEETLKPETTQALTLQPYATVGGPVAFETRSELTVLPVVAQCYYKRLLSQTEADSIADVLQGLRQVHRLDGQAQPYVTTPLFAGSVSEEEGFDLIQHTADRCLWLALLAPKEELKTAAKKALGNNPHGGQVLINIGVMPAIKVPELFEEVGPRARLPYQWEMSYASAEGELEYLSLDVIADSTQGLTQRGVLRLALPAEKFITAPKNDVRANLDAGVGDSPPRLDDPKIDQRLMTWLRLRPLPINPPLQTFSVSWVGLNAVEIDQRQTITNRVIGQGDGTIEQELQLPGQSVEPETLELQVEEEGRGYQTWQRIDDLATAGRDAAVFTLDSEAGTVRFGNGLQGRLIEATRRVRVARMRAGGGRGGNLPAGVLADITAFGLNGAQVTNLKVTQSLPTEGGAEAETLEQAEQRIPALFRHRDRAVTMEDYRRLAAETPSIQMGRVEVLPRFKPQQRRSDVPGVISVMVFPFKAAMMPPNPRPDRPFIEEIHRYLKDRQPLATELYVIGCEYLPLGLSVGVTVRDGFGRETVLHAVRDSLRRFLWALSPGGTDGAGWPLGKAIKSRELEVEIARVPGVDEVRGIGLFKKSGSDWQAITQPDRCAPIELDLQPWQLPELLSVVVVDGDPPADLRGVPNPFAQGIAVPVVPDVC